METMQRDSAACRASAPSPSICSATSRPTGAAVADGRVSSSARSSRAMVSHLRSMYRESCACRSLLHGMRRMWGMSSEDWNVRTMVCDVVYPLEEEAGLLLASPRTRSATLSPAGCASAEEFEQFARSGAAW